jgi:hypothetical protein
MWRYGNEYHKSISTLKHLMYDDGSQNVGLQQKMNNKLSPEQRTERLHQIMRDHKMKAVDVGALLGRDPNTVRIWRSIDPRAIPEDTLERLELKLAAQQAAK